MDITTIHILNLLFEMADPPGEIFSLIDTDRIDAARETAAAMNARWTAAVGSSTPTLR